MLDEDEDEDEDEDWTEPGLGLARADRASSGFSTGDGLFGYLGEEISSASSIARDASDSSLLSADAEFPAIVPS